MFGVEHNRTLVSGPINDQAALGSSLNQPPCITIRPSEENTLANSLVSLAVFPTGDGPYVRERTECKGIATYDEPCHPFHAWTRSVRHPLLYNFELAMDTPAPTIATILVATENCADAARIRDLLHAEFDQIYISTDPDKVPGDFVRYQPNILVLAFDSLNKAEHYYLELYRLCEVAHQYPHRTLILCHKDEIHQIYELCKKEYFDDYILFWPMNNDSSRLLMAVHHAMRELVALESSGPSVAEFAAQARRMAELERMLAQQLTQGDLHIEDASHAIEETGQKISTALDGLPQQFISGAISDSVAVRDVGGLKDGIGRFKHDEIEPHFVEAIESTQPLRRWAHEFKQECEPFLKSARDLNVLVGQIRSTILVVDDDEVQRLIIDKLLKTEGYNLLFARDGVDALNVLRKHRPDLILMDMLMPKMNGLETTRRLKATPEFAGTPVIMITGKSEGKTVDDCMKAGAVDFVVKPFHHITLLAKIAHALNTSNPT